MNAVFVQSVSSQKDGGVGIIYSRLSGRNWVSVADKANRMGEGNAKVHQLRLKNIYIPDLSKSIRKY